MDTLDNTEGPKANISGLYNRVARIYGTVGPDPFAYAGKGLVERMGINQGARVLDVGVGRGANLFPAAEKVGPHGQVIGIDLAELPTYLARTGFTDVYVLQEQTEFIYADAQQWWDAKWTHGTRYSLEHMAPEVLAQFKAEVFARLAEELRPDGIHEEWHLRYVIGTRGA